MIIVYTHQNKSVIKVSFVLTIKLPEKSFKKTEIYNLLKFFHFVFSPTDESNSEINMSTKN